MYMKRILLLLGALFLLSYGSLKADGSPSKDKYIVLLLRLPADVQSLEEAIQFLSNLHITDEQGHSYSYTAGLPDFSSGSITIQVYLEGKPMISNKLIIQTLHSSPTHVTVADISGFNEDQQIVAMAMNPTLVTGATGSGQNHHITVPADDGGFTPVQPTSRAFPNPTEGPVNVVTEGDVPFVRVLLMDQSGHVLQQCAGQPSVRAFFTLRDYPAGLYHLVIFTPRGVERQTLLKR